MPAHVLRLSRLALHTLREDPADAEVPSHRLLVRAGYVRRAAPGIYSWLPLGLRVLRNVERVVREEMLAIGAEEVLLPALLPRELFAASGRWEEYGELLFRLSDRRDAEYLLAPTHEEAFTQVVTEMATSYRDFPLILFQVQLKYRDEARPRAGVLRGREFLMKDSYSFDLDEEGLAASYALHREAYVEIFRRLGLETRVVSALSGAMGGSQSEEFLAPAPVGEDTLARCPACGYAANVEAVETGSLPPSGDATGPVGPGSELGAAAGHPPMEEVETPDAPTIEAVATLLGVASDTTLKSLVVRVGEDLVMALVPGNRELDLERLAGAVAPARAALASPADLASLEWVVKGYLGPQGAAEQGLPVWADPAIAPGSAWIAGANSPGRHTRHVVAGRDFAVDRYLGLVRVEAGDPCPRCGAALELERAIEVGHVFQLGTKYSAAAGLAPAVPGVEPQPVQMGSYGIGISRLVAAIAEQHHDDVGLAWPASVAPVQVHVVQLGGEERRRQVAEEVARSLAEAGFDVLLDDRGASPGVAFADADLLGMPVQVVAGRGVGDGRVELRLRASGARSSVATNAVVEAVREALAGA